MANEILQKVGTQFCFRDTTDFSPAAANDLQQGSPTFVQLQTASVADAAAVNSTKMDFGATRARQYSVIAACELTATPVTGELIEFYWSPSPDATNANGNAGYVDGVDGAYTGTPATLAEGVKQLILIGVLQCSADATTTVQIAHIGTFRPPERYGCLVIKNESGAAFHSDDVETHVVITPIIDEVQ